MPNLFKQELERLGVVDSRSEALAKATDRMHSALCYLDPSQALLVRKLMGEKFFNYINWYGNTEDLNSDIGALNHFRNACLDGKKPKVSIGKDMGDHIHQLELPFK